MISGSVISFPYFCFHFLICYCVLLRSAVFGFIIGVLLWLILRCGQGSNGPLMARGSFWIRDSPSSRSFAGGFGLSPSRWLLRCAAVARPGRGLFTPLRAASYGVWRGVVALPWKVQEDLTADGEDNKLGRVDPPRLS